MLYGLTALYSPLQKFLEVMYSYITDSHLYETNVIVSDI